MQFFGIEILGSQIILSTIVLFILVKTWQSWHNKHISKYFALSWVSLWVIILYCIYYPGFLSGIAKKIGVGRGVDLAVYISIICLFYLIYKIFITMKNLENKLTLLVREIAISAKKNKKTTFPKN